MKRRYTTGPLVIRLPVSQAEAVFAPVRIEVAPVDQAAKRRALAELKEALLPDEVA